MAGVEKLSVGLPAEIGSVMREVVADGEYGSASDVIREALHEWTMRRTQRRLAIAELG